MHLKANKEWIERSLIAHTKVLKSVEFMEAFCLSHSAEEATMRWMESDYLLVSCQSKEATKRILENGFSWWKNIFMSLEEWTTNSRPVRKLVWIKVTGIP